MGIVGTEESLNLSSEQNILTHMTSDIVTPHSNLSNEVSIAESTTEFGLTSWMTTENMVATSEACYVLT